MKVFKVKDGERISSPLLVGFGSMPGDSCAHQYSQVGDGTPVDGHPQLTLYLEQCSNCTATRTRVEGPEAILCAHFPDAKLLTKEELDGPGRSD